MAEDLDRRLVAEALGTGLLVATVVGSGIMAETLTPDLCIIGAGSGGLSVAAGAVQMGASVVLIEKGEMGGDCLNYGCVPSKAILAAAKK
ncbi:MAG: FAD-dependent oxidoreductase, partial [Pseudomonadota bacterium]